MSVLIANDRCELPPLNDSVLETVQVKFNITFPEWLVKILKEQNGGYIDDDYLCEDELYLVTEIQGISEDDDNWKCSITPLNSVISLSDIDNDRVNDKYDNLYVFDSSGMVFFCLDYRRGKYDGIVSVDLEAGDHEPKLIGTIIPPQQ